MLKRKGRDKKNMLIPQKNNGLEAGIDEAGRGCLAGPVTAAAVILPYQFNLKDLNDSKKLSATALEELRLKIEDEALCYGVAHVAPAQIDGINILNASIKAMHLALDQLRLEPSHILVDGNRFYTYKEIPFECIIRGDGKFQNIAAASILAKTHRDAYMKKLSIDFPAYGWDQNKGYPTQKHRKAIRKFGVTPHHRNSFQLLPRQLSIPF